MDSKALVVDLQTLIRCLERDRATHPSYLYLPDEVIVSLGGDPEAHTEVLPGVREVVYRG